MMSSGQNWCFTHGCLRNHKRVHYPSKFQTKPIDGIHELVVQDLILDHDWLRLCETRVDVTAQMVPCWLGGWLRCNWWTAFISLLWRNSLISFRRRSTAEWANCSESVVNSDCFMVVTFKVVHVVRCDNQKVVTMTTPDYPELSLKVVITTTSRPRGRANLCLILPNGVFNI